MNIKLRQLQAFKMIVETGTVSEASVALDLTQSSVSKLLASLEGEIGFQLFDRVGRRLRLSEKGRLFLERTTDAVELLEDIRTAAQDIRDNLGRRLRVCAIGPLAFSRAMPEMLARFSSDFPGFTYTIDAKLRIEIEDWILGGHSDLGLTFLPITREQMRSREFVTTRAAVVVPAGHPLASRRAVAPADLVDEDVIVPKSSVRLRGLVEAEFVQAGVPLRPRYETSNAVSMISLVSRGLGVAVADPFSLTTVAASSVRVVPWAPATELSYGLIWPKPRELALHERALFEHAAVVTRDIVLEVEKTFGLSLIGSRSG